jgi:hypothetical protein
MHFVAHFVVHFVGKNRAEFDKVRDKVAAYVSRR